MYYLNSIIELVFQPGRLTDGASSAQVEVCSFWDLLLAPMAQIERLNLNTTSAFLRGSATALPSPARVSRSSMSSRSSPATLQINAISGPKTKSAAPVKADKRASNLKVEVGIFGTYSGFGITKQNELFVGRMLGFAASLLGEAITAQGILSQLNLETGIPTYKAEPLLLYFITFNLLGAIGGLDRGRLVDEEPAGFPVKPGSIKSALGLREEGPLFGFTRADELYVGRLAQLGVVASTVGEVVTGKTGVPVWQIEPLLLSGILFFIVAAISPGSGKFIYNDE